MAQYTAPAMARHPPEPQRALDASALEATLRRAARAAQPPWLHAEVARRMGDRLAVIRLAPQWLIDWWGFSGAGGATLAASYPKAHRLVIEPTAALALRSRAAARWPWWTVQRWRGGNVDVLLDAVDRPGPADAAEMPAGAPLIWANMMLHAEPDPPALFARWGELLQIDGVLMFSCLGPGTLRELRELYARLGWPAPTPAFVDMHDLGDMLVQAGFADPVLDQETLTLHWANPQALLAELRTLGGNAAPDRYAGLRTPRWRKRLLDELQRLAGPDGRLRLSFEIAYGHAFKAAPRIREGQPTLVSLAQMRALVRSRNSARPS
ncbi:MAG: biotin synthase [Burkholderiaceae bacterium]